MDRFEKCPGGGHVVAQESHERYKGSSRAKMVAIGHHRLHMEHSSALIVFRWRAQVAFGKDRLRMHVGGLSAAFARHRTRCRRHGPRLAVRQRVSPLCATSGHRTHAQHDSMPRLGRRLGAVRPASRGTDLTIRYRPSGDRVQLLIVNWQLPPARLAKRFPKAYIFNTGAPT